MTPLHVYPISGGTHTFFSLTELYHAQTFEAQSRDEADFSEISARFVSIGKFQ